MTIEVMKLALEALERATTNDDSMAKWDAHKAATAALRQAIEEAGEPVAWYCENNFFDTKEEAQAWWKEHAQLADHVTPLYAHPEKEWIGLTDEEILNIVGRFGVGYPPNVPPYTRKLFDAIEAMKQALEALENDNPLGRAATITALRQAIEEAEKQKPVGKFAQFTDGLWREVTEYSEGIMLYTHPDSEIETLKRCLYQAQEAAKHLAKPEQEPVATIQTWHKMGEQHAELLNWHSGLDKLPDGNHYLYTHPEPQHKEWVGLTDDEVMVLNRQPYDAQIGLLPLTFYRAIEAKLKEKNHG